MVSTTLGSDPAAVLTATIVRLVECVAELVREQDKHLQVSSARLPLPAFSPRAVLMYSAALGGEGAVALQLREAAPGEAALTEVAAGTVAGRLHEDRALAIACHDPELLADLLHAAADIGNGSAGGLSSLLGSAGSASPDPAGGSDASDSLPPSDHDADRSSSGSSSSGVTTVSVSVAGLAGLAGLDTRPPLAVKRVRPKAASPNRQGPQQCQVCNKIFGNASALAKHKLTHSDERKYVCGMCAKAFKRQDHLNGHMLTHRNKKPYECKASGCGKSYCDARSLRRHTENHHHAPHPQDASSNGSNSNSSTNAGCDRGAERSCIQYARGASPGSPARPAPAHSAHSDSNSSGSDKASPAATDGDSAGGSPSPAGSPPAPLTPPAPRAPPRPVAKPQPTAKHKTFAITVQHGQQRSPTTSSSLAGSTTPSAPATTSAGGGGTTGGVAARAAEAPAGVAASKPHEIKPVECNLCHRKFKNIPALNGHMRLHGGYFKKDSENKKLDKKEATGPPLQTASVSVRALIEEKIISRRGANAANLESLSSARGVGFVTPAPPPLTSTAASRPLATPLPHSTPPPPAPSAARAQFVSPRAPTAVSPATHRDSTLIELLKKGTKVAVKRSASDPGAQSPEIAFRPELFGVTFAADDGYFSPALNDDAFQFSSTTDHLDDLASLEDYASVAASLRERSPVGFPSNRRLAAVLNSPLPEGLADFGAYHSTNSTSIEPALPSPGFAYPTPPASHEARSPSQTASNAVPPRASSPLSAAFFTATMSSAEEVEEALEEVLPDECDAGLDVYAALDESTTPQDFPTRLHEQMMLNSEDPLLSSNPREFGGRRKFAFGQTYRIVGRDPSDPRMASVLIESNGELKLVHAAWPSTDDTQRGAGTSGIPGLQVEVEGREVQCGDVFLSPSSIPASPVRSGRKRARAETAGLRGPHRSRLRMDDREHYTPLPILNPDRFGLGLYAELYPGSFLPPLDEAGTEAPSESRRVPRINVGPEHQACIPSVEPDRGRLDREPSCEQLLWDPGINDTLDDNEVRMFMDLAMCAAMPVGGHSREFALQTLGECGGDVRAATLRLMSRTPARPDDDASSGRQDPHHHQRWTPEEVEAFLAGLRDYDKDFYKISRLIRSKDSKQCVQFYYFWKKVTKDYKSLFLQSWSPDTRGAHQSLTSRGLTPQGHSPCTGSPAPYDSEEFPCKICGKVFNKVKSRSAHMKSHRPLDAESKRPKVEKPYEKVEKHDERSQPPPEHGKTPLP